MYITPAAFLLFAEGDRHQDVADQSEIVCLPEELRVFLGQLQWQVGEVILTQTAKEERTLDDAVPSLPLTPIKILQKSLKS
ncbi:hypothetical protein, partial [Ruminococcus champanellensis]